MLHLNVGPVAKFLCSALKLRGAAVWQMYECYTQKASDVLSSKEYYLFLFSQVDLVLD